jgi:stage II sporulation protein P
MISIKVIKPGKWMPLIVVLLAAVSLFIIFRGFMFAYSSVEVLAPTGQPSDAEASDERLLDEILKATIDKAFPVLAVNNGGYRRPLLVRGLSEVFRRFNYRDPKNLIIAELPIVGNYNLSVVSRGRVGDYNWRDPYDPEEDLKEILNQYNPDQVRIDQPPAGQGQQIQMPKKTKLDMDMPVVLIYHTHTSEAYEPSKEYNYTPTDVDRTIDPRYSVVRVGKELKDTLEKEYGIKSVHITTFHDYPDYSPSYSRSLASAREALKEYPSIKIVLDIHRDALPMRNKSEEAYARNETTIRHGGTEIARLMMVWGPDAQNANETRKFAELLKDKINEQIPGLCRKVLEKPTGAYNQHISNYSALVEVGSNANTMEEALRSVPYLARSIAGAIAEIEE